MAKQLEHPVKLYATSGIEPNTLPVEPDFHIVTPNFSVEKISGDQSHVSIDQALDLKYILYKGTFYTIRDTITFFANRAGGAHYAQTMPESFVNMMNFRVNEQSLIVALLVSFTETVMLLARGLLNKIVAAEIHLLVYADAIGDGLLTLYDANHKADHMRLTIDISHDGLILIRVTNMNGVMMFFHSDRLIDFSEPRHLSLHYIVNNDLMTEFRIGIDGAIVGLASVNYPFMIVNYVDDFQRFYGKTKEDKQAKHAFALGEIINLAGTTSTWDSANLMMYLEKMKVDPDRPVVYFTEGAYGQTDVDSSTMEIVGTARHVAAREAMPAWGKDSSKHEARPIGW
ncbi:MAG: hypothetical protein EOO61_18765 [Hymenobacter sp.]|nr:MAG: hypothetical protein EOO61_18765 [Hymenobacter sp.]